jgi:hypothetical protein
VCSGIGHLERVRDRCDSLKLARGPQCFRRRTWTIQIQITVVAPPALSQRPATEMSSLFFEAQMWERPIFRFASHPRAPRGTGES